MCFPVILKSHFWSLEIANQSPADPRGSRGLGRVRLVAVALERRPLSGEEVGSALVVIIVLMLEMSDGNEMEIWQMDERGRRRRK